MQQLIQENNFEREVKDYLDLCDRIVAFTEELNNGDFKVQNGQAG